MECLFSFVTFFLDKQKESDSLQRSEIKNKLGKIKEKFNIGFWHSPE